VNLLAPRATIDAMTTPELENPLQYLIDAIHAYVAGAAAGFDEATRTKAEYIAALQRARREAGEGA
jgi:hypothetical protein